MKKFIVIIVLVLSANFSSNAQDYQTAVGLRLGAYNGASVKHFLNEKGAIEGILTTKWNSFQITGLYEYHLDFPDVDELNWYFGGGASVRNYQENINKYTDTGSSLGLVGVIGIEYTFIDIPLSLSLDWMPYFPLVYDYYIGGYDGGGLTIRYTF